MKYYTYILYSETLDKYYIGYTHNLQQRLEKHGQKHKGFTGTADDWKLVWFETFEQKTMAMQREKAIKRKKSRNYIEDLIRAFK